MERASYASGRLGAGASLPGGVHCDLGAQVLSIVDPTDERSTATQRPQAAHGITPLDVDLAHELVTSLESRGLLVPAPDDALCGTEERLNWPGFWRHFWGASDGGLRRVLRTLLEDAGVQPSFGVRVGSLEATAAHDGASRLRVRGVRRIWGKAAAHSAAGAASAAGTSPAPGHTAPLREEPWVGDYDCVVACVPGPNALEIDGLVDLLSPLSASVLRRVGYDAR